MLVGRKCNVKNVQFGKATCPPEFKDLQESPGVIVAGPNLNQSEDSYDYSFLVLLPDGRLFAVSHKFITVAD